MLLTRVNYLLIVLNCLHQSYGHIFDVKYSYLYPVNRTAYSSVFLQKNENRFLAGAPKNDRISICNATTCQSFSFTVPNEAGFEMLGASIAAGDTVDDATFICAPRYIATPHFRVNGRCFAVHEHFKAIHSLDNPYQQVKLYNGSYEFYHAHGQVGFSAKYVHNGEVLFGAPGVLSWKGTVIKHIDLDTKDILQPEKILDRNSYLGYAIEFGEYYFGGRKRRCAIGGAPRGDNLLGQILKPQKCRKPLCDLDLGNEESDDTGNMNKTSRRVSFASNNFIKPFVADPEKNTIWDLTYEEAIEQSGSSQSIKIVQENKENDGSPLNVTMFYAEDMCELDITSPVGRIEANAVVETQTNYNAEDMEFTVGIDFNAQCIIVNDRNEDCGGDMEFTTPIDNFRIISTENETNRETTLTDMEFTTPIDVLIQPGNKTNIENVDMSFEISCDDTEKLINYDLSGVKGSDFSKVITGDLEPSFPNLPAMPLRGINSTSFVQSLPSEIRSCGDSRDVSHMNTTSVVPSTMDKENWGYQSMDMDITCNSIEDENEDIEKNKQNKGSTIQETQSKEDNSILELCAKLTEENTSLLCDMSIISMDDPSIQSQNDENKDEDARISAVCNEIEFINVRQFEEMSNRIIAVNELAKKVDEKLMSDLNRTKLLVKKQKEICSERERLMKEFDNIRLKFQDACSNNRHVELEETGNKEPDIITWKDQLLTLSEGNEGYWNTISMEGNPYKFSTLYGTIHIILELNEENGQVLNINLEDHISESSETIALYIHKIFNEKLKLKHIQSALGEKFEVLSLLDYIRLTMEKLLEIDRDFSLLVLTHGLQIDNDFRIKFNLISVNCMFTWEFIIDINDYDNINSDMVSFRAKIGDLKERDIKKCMNVCPKGFAFVKAFVTALYNFKDSLERK